MIFQKQTNNKKLTYTTNMTTIEQLIDTIMQLKDIAQQALELAEAYSGGESEVEEELRNQLQKVLDDHHSRD